MKALLVIDVQNAIVELKDFTKELTLIEQVIQDFRSDGHPVIFIRHIDDQEESPLYRDSEGSHIHDSILKYAETVVEKQTPSAFYNTNLAETLEKLGVKHLFIVGFETEFCCMFSAISAYDRGYKVTLIKDASGTGNTQDTYEMKDLDIQGFVGKVLDWSGAIEVLDHDSYVQNYAVHNTI
ncbi:isochorismatase [Paenibacillus sp. FSL H7-0326]|uniref:isochorismatase family protein n=1 Tax=Paenibacillus sp. FSL H7-0326 TaxID=1921144 RepID=UPI00096CE82A|nr:isochorismatase family protein [Paenibacillus sp. FSL H7-0326]OMC70744.1 isochorismatase [Paenibacillus sp. FSL H7-0326]